MVLADALEGSFAAWNTRDETSEDPITGGRLDRSALAAGVPDVHFELVSQAHTIEVTATERSDLEGPWR
ncbi:MAG TPA: hypothetical protein VEP49_13290 [Acidimicrobiia bacterium]|nr:hypothetical protein [Acidimicrobiia bacterium]